ncbi:cell division protein FtsA, partial [Flavobacteriaceae bacterium]|nr:cell division protein FtsA [Flavobacteriaceae bacterium]
NYGHEEQKKKLIAGIVLTGGGAQLQHLKQLVEYITGMDTRIGYPNEHLAGDSDSETTSPLYATAVGLVMNSLESKARANRIAKPEDGGPTGDGPAPDDGGSGGLEEEISDSPQEPEKQRTSIFDTWAEKFKQFLDNAE